VLPAGELAIGGFGGSRCTFAADAEGYKYIVWVFNACFAISSPELCQPPSFVKKESLGTAACYHSAQKKSCSYEKLAIEHAVASAAQRLRSNPESANNLEGKWFYAAARAIGFPLPICDRQS
jgi:hypothetical protein